MKTLWNQDSVRRRWFLHGALAYTCIGAGLSMMMDASALRTDSPEDWTWFWEGTLGLVVLMTGLSFFGNAIRLWIRMDRSYG